MPCSCHCFFIHPAAREEHRMAGGVVELRFIEVLPPAPQTPLSKRKTSDENPVVAATPTVMAAAVASAPSASVAVAPQLLQPIEIPAPALIEPKAPPAPVLHSPVELPPSPVTAARFDAEHLNNPPSDYPPISRRLREERRALLFVSVSAEGAAAVVNVREGSGFARLEEAALAAVRQWRFVPARRGAQTIAATGLVPIEFTLRGS